MQEIKKMIEGRINTKNTSSKFKDEKFINLFLLTKNLPSNKKTAILATLKGLKIEKIVNFLILCNIFYPLNPEFPKPGRGPFLGTLFFAGGAVHLFGKSFKLPAGFPLGSLCFSLEFSKYSALV